MLQPGIRRSLSRQALGQTAGLGPIAGVGVEAGSKNELISAPQEGVEDQQ